jgi:hypothetical protein
MTDNITTFEDFLWRLVRKDIAAYLRGGPDMELANRGRAVCNDFCDHVQAIRDCWAEARALRAERVREREGA